MRFGGVGNVQITKAEGHIAVDTLEWQTVSLSVFQRREGEKIEILLS
jgi:hypothetical protein